MNFERKTDCSSLELYNFELSQVICSNPIIIIGRVHDLTPTILVSSGRVSRKQSSLFPCGQPLGIFEAITVPCGSRFDTKWPTQKGRLR